MWTVTAVTKFKKRLLLGRIAMSNLESVLKSRDITLPTKVHCWSFSGPEPGGPESMIRK